MYTSRKLTFGVIGAAVLAALPVSAMAATNTAVNGGGAVTLTNSPAVTVNSTQLALVKAVYDTAGNCLASSDNDAACTGTGADKTQITVPTGTEIVFILYVANSAGVAANDIRFQDLIDDIAADYFEFQANKYAAAKGLRFGTRAATGATKANIYTAVETSGANLTNAYDGSTVVNEYCGIDTAASPDSLICGGNAVSPDNDQVNVANDQVWGVAFHVIKR